jgi:hypothetical protein
MNTNTRKVPSTLAYLVFILAIVEIVLQVFYYFNAGGFLFSRVGLPIYVSNEYSGIFNRPNLQFAHNTNEFRTIYYTNSRGFRVSSAREEYPLEKAPDTYRVVLLGPSFAYGWGVNYEESFAAILKTLLEEKGFAGGQKVEVINAGVPYLAPAPHLNWFKHVGSTYHPDLVIQFIYGSMTIGSDIKLRVREDGYLIPQNQSTSERIRGWLKNSALVFYAWNLYTKLGSTKEESKHPASVRGAGRELSMQTTFDATSPLFTDSNSFYNDLKRATKDSGADLLVVYFPLSYAIHPEDVSRWRHLGVTDVKAQMAADEAFCKHLNSSSIHCLDITKDLHLAALGGKRLYFWLDIHWTAEGNAVAARVVANYLKGSDNAVRH